MKELSLKIGVILIAVLLLLSSCSNSTLYTSNDETPYVEPDLQEDDLFGATSDEINRDYIFFLGKWADEKNETLLKRDRKTDIVSPVCLDAACLHDEVSGCPLFGCRYYMVYGDSLYFERVKSEIRDNIAQDVYQLLCYDLKSGSYKMLYESKSQFYLRHEYVPCISQNILDDNLEAMIVFSRIQEDGSISELYRWRHGFASFGIYDERYQILFSSLVCPTIKKLDMKTGREEIVYESGEQSIQLTAGAMILGKYLLLRQFEETVCHTFLLNIDNGETTTVIDLPNGHGGITTKGIWYLEEESGSIMVNGQQFAQTICAGNHFHFYDVETGQESIYDLPDIAAVSYFNYPSFVDGHLCFGEQILPNGATVYDFRIDVNSGEIVYYEEKPEPYSPATPQPVRRAPGELQTDGEGA